MLKINKFRKVNPSKRRQRIELFFKISLWGFVVGFSLGIISGYFIGKKEREDTDTASNFTKSTEIIAWDENWDYACLSQIHSDTVTLYRSNSSKRKDLTVAVNAGHGTLGGENYQIPCHPDGSVYVNEDGSLSDITFTEAVSLGQELKKDSEENAMLDIALRAKIDLLKAGYDVLMIRESEDCQLDNIARTVFANENADFLVSLHCDSADSDKGLYYIGVLETGAYLSMDPVAARWQQHKLLGDSITTAAREQKLTIYDEQQITMDLTQTSYAKIPAVTLETGDQNTIFTSRRIRKISKAIVNGLDIFETSEYKSTEGN